MPSNLVADDILLFIFFIIIIIIILEKIRFDIPCESGVKSSLLIKIQKKKKKKSKCLLSKTSRCPNI